MTKVKKTLEAGKKYGHLEALYEAPRGRHGEHRFICRCDCGHIGNFIVALVMALDRAMKNQNGSDSV